VTRYIPRIPKNYDGPEITTRRMSELLPSVLSQVSDKYQERPDLILASWPEIVGPQLAPMTQAVSFDEGVLYVKVKNSTLYSLLSKNDKPKLIESLRKKFPKVSLRTIVFRIG